MTCKHANIEVNCPCPSKNCPRHGICCECVKYHREKGQLPYCLRGIKG